MLQSLQLLLLSLLLPLLLLLLWLLLSLLQSVPHVARNVDERLRRSLALAVVARGHGASGVALLTNFDTKRHVSQHWQIEFIGESARTVRAKQVRLMVTRRTLENTHVLHNAQYRNVRAAHHIHRAAHVVQSECLRCADNNRAIDDHVLRMVLFNKQ